MTTDLPRVRAVLYGQPWAIREDVLDAMCEIVETKLSIGAQDFERDRDKESERKVAMLGGVAVVPIVGPIMRRATMFDRISGATSIAQIQTQFKEALGMDAKAVMLKFDTPGGDVTGIAETAQMIFDARSKTPKPVIAFSEGVMASAGYWLAAQTDRIITTPDATTGSIGVIVKLLDTTRAEKNIGLDTHVLRTGPNKATGIGPITDAQLEVYREIRDEAFSAFTKAVENGRNMKLSDDAKTGRIYTGAQALKDGLVDELMTFTETINAFGG